MIYNRADRNTVTELVAFPTGEVLQTSQLTFGQITQNLIGSWFDAEVSDGLRMLLTPVLIGEAKYLLTVPTLSYAQHQSVLDRVLVELYEYRLAYTSLVRLPSNIAKETIVGYSDLDMLIRVLGYLPHTLKTGVGKLVRNEVVSRQADIEVVDSSIVDRLVKFVVG